MRIRPLTRYRGLHANLQKGGERVSLKRIGLTLATATALIGLLASTGSAAKKSCTVKKSRTQAKSSKVRVYRTGIDAEGQNLVYYGCYKPTARKTKLFTKLFAPNTFQEFKKKTIEIEGKYVAFAATDLDSSGRGGDRVRLFDVKSGKKLFASAEITDDIPVTEIVISDRGNLAWMEIEGQSSKVVAHDDDTGTTTLDSGDGIEEGSLKLRGSTLSWKKSGQSFTSTLK